jgi:hypothetical protein
MTPFHRVSVDMHSLEVARNDLLSRPCEFFTGIFKGQVPTPQQKLMLIEESMHRLATTPIFQNDIYTVQVEAGTPFVHLHIRRNDWGPCKDWRDFQLIKNYFVGTENEAVELFPAESRLVDTSNVYHLWVHADPRFRFPLGLAHRLVTQQPIGFERQRELQQVA